MRLRIYPVHVGRGESLILLAPAYPCRVLGCVSCEVIQPQPNRPTEGQLFFNVELSPMASPAFEVGRSVPTGSSKQPASFTFYSSDSRPDFVDCSVV